MRDYQLDGFKYLKTLDYYGFGGILADEMGLGKTVQTIAFLASEEKQTSLIVVPTSLLYNWNDEFEKFASREFGYASGINGHYEVALQVESFSAVDCAYADITAKGAVPVVAPITCPWGQRTCYIADPEGNLIEIGSFNSGE